jgi:mannose-6-phosphate isomerase-like protein (cupin superfamily)
MKRRLFFLFGMSFLFVASANTITNNNRKNKVKQDSTTIISKSFSLKDLVEKRIESGEPFIRFLNVPTIKMFIYSLPAGGVDKQTPHKLDEVYYVTSGEAELSVENKNYTVSPGSIIFVKAGAKHKFHSIKKDLTVIVFFSKAKSG